MKKIQRELQREFGRVEFTRGGHVRIRLANGRAVITSATPSDVRTLRNVRADVRRRMIVTPKDEQ